MDIKVLQEVDYTGYVHFVGVQTEPEQAIYLKLPNGKIVTAHGSADLFFSFGLTSSDATAQTWCRVSGTATVNQDGAVQRLSALQESTVVASAHAAILEQVSVRIDHLSNLERGWIEGGQSFKGKRLGWVKDALLHLIGESGAARPGVFPTPDGNIQVEWSGDETDITIVFSLDDPEIAVEISRGEEEREESYRPNQSRQLVALLEPMLGSEG